MGYVSNDNAITRRSMDQLKPAKQRSSQPQMYFSERCFSNCLFTGLVIKGEATKRLVSSVTRYCFQFA
jgi:hypothetical protein